MLIHHLCNIASARPAKGNVPAMISEHYADVGIGELVENRAKDRVR